jgi:hypothetical protein
MTPTLPASRAAPPVDFATAVPYVFPDEDGRAIERLASTAYPPRRLGAIRADLARVARVLAAAGHSPALLLESKGGLIYPDVVAAAIMGVLPWKRRAKMVLMGEMWQPNPGLRGRLERLLVRLADRVVDRYAVQSTEELTVFPRLWRVDPHKLRLNPLFYYHQDVGEVEGRTTSEDFIFAGGDSLRDYTPFLEAARRFPNQGFIIRARRLEGMTDVPRNVVAGGVPKARYFDEMRRAKAVVVALTPGLVRAAGQQTYLNAMFLGKPTLVAECFGVRDHITHGVNGLIADGTPEGYAREIEWIVDEANAGALDRMGRAARDTAKTFNYDAHARRLLDIIDELFVADLPAPAERHADHPRATRRSA